MFAIKLVLVGIVFSSILCNGKTLKGSKSPIEIELLRRERSGEDSHKLISFLAMR
jgi:hypothetical protein